MDVCDISKYGCSTIAQELPCISSPEMFESDNEDETNETIEDEEPIAPVSPEKPSQADLVFKSDSDLVARVNKLLSGIPPPPKLTICRTDCSEFLIRIYENHHLFCTPNILPGKSFNLDQISSEQQKENISTNSSYHRTKSTSRNLSTAFDACDPECNINNIADTSDLKNKLSSDNFRTEQVVSNSEKNLINTSENRVKTLNSNNLQVTTDEDNIKEDTQRQSLLYHTVNEKEVASLTWPEAYHHAFHGIHYNRNKAIEEFENHTSKLCERYIGVDTQSTCTVWFSKQAPGSAKKRYLLAKRNNGLSPGKRLNHLTKRRRTFSSANLQGLALNNKRLLVLNIKKPSVKRGKSPRGKSPRGKSPRGKSPRGTPRSSTKKKVSRRLILDDPSPLKSKLETSKRALFQSPPSDHAGPSKLFTNGPNPQSIKRKLFTQATKENDSEGIQKVPEESRKRKCEEELEGPRFKWPKSLSFDCSREMLSNTVNSWDHNRHSSSTVVEKNKQSMTEGKNELSDAHRKKLLWAVAEALRSKGIGMTHPQFKQYATNLARLIKKCMPDLENRNIPREPGSTSDRMLKLAKRHVLFVIDAQPTD